MTMHRSSARTTPLPSRPGHLARRLGAAVSLAVLAGASAGCAASTRTATGASTGSADSGAAAAPIDWTAIFNGRDLTGWRPNRQPGSYSVRDGILRVQAVDESSHLFYVGSQPDGFVRLKNFELEVVARSEPGSNSGIFFHSDPASAAGAQHHLAKGYEVQLNSSEREARKTGSLYSVVDLPVSPVDETRWFTMRIRVDGRRIGVWLNDRQVVDYTEPDSVQRPPERAGKRIDPNGGAIAIQAHDPNSTFFFRSIRLRRLPD